PSATHARPDRGVSAMTTLLEPMTPDTELEHPRPTHRSWVRRFVQGRPDGCDAPDGRAAADPFECRPRTGQATEVTHILTPATPLERQ
ncbi:MAG TPA: hypothetical protein VGI44_09095, partial [Acidimicrobiales bacterium]